MELLKKSRAFLLLFVTFFFWGSVYVGGKLISDDVPAPLLGCLRCFVASFPLMLMAQRTARRLSGETAAAMRGDAVFELAAGELRYAECVSLSEKPWKRIDGDTFGSFSDVEIGIQEAGERSLWLTVRVNQGEELLYERTGRVELLNVPFYGTGRLEGSERTGQAAAGGASYPAVWYIDGGDS